MSFKELKKRFSLAETTTTTQKQSNSLLPFRRLTNKPFWIWNVEEHKVEGIKTKGDCCFNHIIGLPQKNGVDRPLITRYVFTTLITHPQPKD